MIKNKRISLQDVADQIGVTKMTVSRFLKDPMLVAESTRLKIEATINALGYIPNRTPAMLLNAKSRVIGVLIPSLTNSVFSEVLRGIERSTMPADYQTMIAHYGYDKYKEERAIESLLSYNIDGLLLSESIHTERSIKMIEQVGIPVVEMFDIQKPLMQAVGFNSQKASQEMTLTMIERGYRNIVYLGARMDTRTQIRLKGYQKAMRKHGLATRFISTEAASSYTLGADLFRKIIRAHPQTDGIFCTNDDLAIGVVFECLRSGIKIPEEIGVAGFHGLNVGQALFPKLASVITPREEVGQIAAKELIDRLENIPLTHKKIDLGYTISLGESI